MNVYSISGYDYKGKYHFFYHEAENKNAAISWARIMGYDYHPLSVRFVCSGGYENIGR